MEHAAKVRSFKRRGTRITPGQQSALDAGWPKWGIDDLSSLRNIDQIFEGRPIALEIGYGMGETTAAMAAAQPDIAILAVDIHRPGAGALLRAIDRSALTNVRLVEADVTDLLPFLPDDSLDEVRVFFPDPWPKSRHHKRRLIQKTFVSALTEKLKPAGLWHLATDWQPYAEWIEEVFSELPNLRGGVVAKPTHRPTTRFEGQGIRKGHLVTDLLYSRVSS